MNRPPLIPTKLYFFSFILTFADFEKIVELEVSDNLHTTVVDMPPETKG